MNRYIHIKLYTDRCIHTYLYIHTCIHTYIHRQVSLKGTWYQIVNGKTSSSDETKKYQGMGERTNIHTRNMHSYIHSYIHTYKYTHVTEGNTTREAKFDAATNAILKMGDAIPGDTSHALSHIYLYIHTYIHTHIHTYIHT
jgi:hypothetical protein